jgi:hypothetical protein
MVAVPVALAEGENELEEQANEPLSVEEILTRDPDRGSYVEQDRCIAANRIRNIEVIDSRHVSIEMNSNEYYLIQFEKKCHDLRRGKPVYLERQSSRLCRLDTIHGMRDTGFGFQRGQMCQIPGFQAVTKEQIVLLKDALKAERRRAREERKARRSS